jgi:hypothetical protein
MPEALVAEVVVPDSVPLDLDTWDDHRAVPAAA